MTDFRGSLDSAENSDSKRDRAIFSFLDLGEKLRAAKEKPAIGDGLDVLVSTIETEIIPRLMLTHKTTTKEAPGNRPNLLAPTQEDKTRFLWIVMNESASSSRSFVTALINRGIPRETIYLDLLTDAARRLGEMWERDQCDFTDVTIGLCRLHQVLREQSSLYGAETIGRGDAPKILLSTASGDQHVFGVVMVAEFFRREGWHVWCEPAAALDVLETLVAAEWFDLIGLSAASSATTDRIASEIIALRAASLNKSVKIMVGGSLFIQQPDLVAAVGADATAADGRLAAEAAKSLLVSAIGHV